MKNRELKPIALYLPQYHPIPENDEWWGKGFTEWTNVAKAKPLFKGHYQPHLPADLGFYDLRLPEVRQAQADLAREYGIYGFCYYHYWFGNGKQLLERPFNDVLNLGKPNFPFMLCWANQTWSGHWFGADRKVLIQQTYQGDEDVDLHFQYLFKAFQDDRYIKVDGKPVFKILDLNQSDTIARVADRLQNIAIKHGFPGLYLIAGNLHADDFNPLHYGFNALTDPTFGRTLTKVLNGNQNFLHKFFYNRFTEKKVNSYYYRRSQIIAMDSFMTNYFIPQKEFENIPIVIPNWDNTPRAGGKGIVLTNCLPEHFVQQLRICDNYIKQHNQTDLLFVKSWNEWAEGNYLEPDKEYGKTFLEALKKYMIAREG